MIEAATRNMEIENSLNAGSEASQMKMLMESGGDRVVTTATGYKLRLSQIMKSKKGKTELGSPAEPDDFVSIKRPCFFKVGHQRKPLTASAGGSGQGAGYNAQPNWGISSPVSDLWSEEEQNEKRGETPLLNPRIKKGPPILFSDGRVSVA